MENLPWSSRRHLPLSKCMIPLSKHS
jgi:hypothetical protein